MTKTVRIENADTSQHKVQIQIMQRGIDGAPDTKVGEPIDLSHPTQMITPTIWKGRYLIVEEVE